LTVWTNHHFSAAEEQQFRRAAEGHRLLVDPGAKVAPALGEADVAFGQPPIEDVVRSPRLRWVQLSSAGYASYDQPALRQAFAARGAVLTKSSYVYASPCAEHVLSFMLAGARRLPSALSTQRGDRSWPQAEQRSKSVLLEDQSVVLVGFGSIGARLVELLRPFTRHLTGVRRGVRGDEGIEMLTFEDPRVPGVLGGADHVVDLLPGVAATTRYFDRDRFARIKSGATFYNVGRGSTVDQEALLERLEQGQLKAAWLDVTEPEPLPPDHPLWRAPNCFITPHAAGGHHDEGTRLVAHFIANLKRFERGEPVRDRAF
jgi:phosphoglycerate dehydrogenase-like enzyme